MDIIHKAFHNKANSFSINQTSKLYPFHGSSKYLFDKFLIIGYNSLTISQEFIPNKSKLLQQKVEPIIKNSPINPFVNSFSFPIDVEPMILTEICSDYEKVLLDNDMILTLLFPNKPLGYYFPNDYMRNPKKPDYPKPFSLVFNSNPSSNEGLKKSYNGIAYFTYDQHEEQINSNTTGYFVTPKAFVILSEFPFYSSYLRLLSEISKMFKSAVDVPLEMTLYNLIKFTPSPLSSSICINFPHSTKPIDNTANANAATPTNASTLLFPQLTGLPIIDINLHKVFYHLGATNVIKLFLFSFLEKDILVFSTNLELISLVIYAFHTLNYPLNDGNYYWLNATVSYTDLVTENSIFVGQSYPTMLGVHSAYNPAYLQRTVLKDHFVMDLDNNVFEYNSGRDKDKDDARLVSTFLHFLKKVFKGSNSLHNLDLYVAVRCLYTELEPLCARKPIRATRFYEDINEVHSKTGEVVDYNGKVQEMFYKFVVKIVSIMYTRISLHSILDSKTNMNDRNRLKETFYNEFSRDNSEYMKTQEEQSFFEQLLGTFKFSSFIEGFVKSHSDNGLYQVSFVFLDEFANLMKHHASKTTTKDASDKDVKDAKETKTQSRINDFNEMNFTSTIKELYKRKYRNTKAVGSSGFQLFRNSTKPVISSFMKKNSSIIKVKEYGDISTAEASEITITFPTFELLHNADTSLMQKFHNEIYNIPSNATVAVVWKDMTLLNIVQGSVVYPEANAARKSVNGHHSSSAKSTDTKKGLYKYKQAYLNQKLLMKYIRYLNDSDTKTKEQIMPWASFHLTNELKDIRLSHIANEVEKTYINSKHIEIKDLLVCDIVLLFALTIPLSQGSDLIELMFLFSEFLDMNVITRKYFQELLFVFEHLSHDQSNEETNRSLKICVGLVLNKLRMKGLVSNSVLTKLINLLNADTPNEGVFYDSDDETAAASIQLELVNNITYKSSSPIRRDPSFYVNVIQEYPHLEGVLENFPDFPSLPNEPSAKREMIPQIKLTFQSDKGNNYALVSYIYSPKTIFKDLSDLRDKLLYGVNKVNGGKLTTECLQYYCVSLMFYLRHSNMFKDCSIRPAAVCQTV